MKIPKKCPNCGSVRVFTKSEPTGKLAGAVEKLVGVVCLDCFWEKDI